MENSIVNVTENYHQLSDLFTRSNNGELSTLNLDNLTDIVSNLPEITRAIQSFGKKDSQTFSKLTSLTMVASSPYGRLKQCLAIIEKKQSALKENLFLLRKQKNKVAKLNIDKAKLTQLDHDKYYIIDLETIDLEIEEIICNIGNATLYIEGAIKDLGSYQDAYLQIKKNYNIPNDWNEEHYEECEVQEHIKLAFKHAVRDKIMTGRINVGTQEYLEQFGIHPLEADKRVANYLNDEIKKESNDIETLYEFLENAAVKYKDEYKKCMKHIGLTGLVTSNLLYVGNKK